MEEIKLFNWNGSLRLPSNIYCAGRMMTPAEYRDYCRIMGTNPNEVLDQLQSTSFMTNTELTMGAIAYHMNNVICTRISKNDNGRIMIRPEKILSPKYLDTLPFNNYPTHPHDLAHGRVSTIDLLDGVEGAPWSLGKRMKLFTGFKVRGYHPLPESIKKIEEAPDGVIYISQSYASKFKLQGPNENIIRTLSNGDKIGGAVRDGDDTLVIKGSAVIRDQTEDMIIPKDALKLIGTSKLFNEYTRMYIKSCAIDRIGSKRTKLSYQIGQFYPEIVRDEILNHLNRSWNGTSEYNWYDMIAGRASLMDYVELLSWEADDGRKYHPIVNEIVEDDMAATMKELDPSQWVEDVLKPTIDELVSSGRRNKIYEPRIKLVIHAVLRYRMDRLINMPVHGIWGVLMPHSGSTDELSIPRNLWHYLGCPDIVCALRYPVKGKSSLVKFRTVCHDDGYDLRVHPDVVSTIWNGDFDGDLIQVISKPVKLVQAAYTVGESYAISKKCQDEVKNIFKPMMKKIKDKMDNGYDRRKAQCIVSGWRPTVALATTIRDNAYTMGLTEEELVKLMEVIIQPSLAQMDGAPPIGKILVGDPTSPSSKSRRGRPDWISKLTGIPVEKLVNSDGETNRWACQSLNELRCSMNMAYNASIHSLVASANFNEGESNPHNIILSAFKDLEPY